MSRQVILVCGATGNTGKAVVDSLLANTKSSADEVEIRALVRDQAKITNKLEGVTYVVGQYENPSSLASAFRGVTACYLSCSNVLNQVELEVNVIKAAEASESCEYLVKLGTCHAVLDHSDDGTIRSNHYTSSESIIAYGRLHFEVEEYLRTSSRIGFTVLNPNCFFQNHLGDIFGTLPTTKTIIYPHDVQPANLVDTRDVGAIAAKLLLLPDHTKHLGQYYHVCGPKAYSSQDLATIYSKELGMPIKAINCTEEESAKGMMSAGFPEWLSKAIAKNFAVFWGTGALEYPSSPEVLALHSSSEFKTMEDWIQEMAPMVIFVDAEDA